MSDTLFRFLCLFATVLLLAACASDTRKTGTAQVKLVRHHPKPQPDTAFIPPRPPLPSGSRSVDDVLVNYAPYALHQLRPHFERAGVAYPPRELTLIALKQEKKLELWARDAKPGGFRFIRDYDIRAASGKHGPKLRQGDRQVPEGVYRVVRLNPNSNYHLSMRLNYPNEFDRMHAGQEGRTEPGSDIYIHGNQVSAGCLAMGDAVIEELFVLAAHVGVDNIKVVIAPHDPRVKPLNPNQPDLPDWTSDLYREISGQILALAPPPSEPVRVSSNRPTPPPGLHPARRP